MMSGDFGYCCFGRFQADLRLGNEHILGVRTSNFLKSVKETAEQFSRRLEIGERLWRAQRGCKFIGTDQVLAECYKIERMLPNEKVGDGRANKRGKPVFYAATQPKLAIQETRPWKSQLVSVAAFEIECDRRILDLTCQPFVSTIDLLHTAYRQGERPVEPIEFERAAWSDIAEAFATPVTRADDPRDYLPTQVLSELFHSCGFEGIAYRSSLTRRDSDISKAGYNILLFDYENLRHMSSEVVEVIGSDIEYKTVLSDNC